MYLEAQGEKCLIQELRAAECILTLNMDSRTFKHQTRSWPAPVPCMLLFIKEEPAGLRATTREAEEGDSGRFCPQNLWAPRQGGCRIRVGATIKPAAPTPHLRSPDYSTPPQVKVTSPRRFLRKLPFRVRPTPGLHQHAFIFLKTHFRLKILNIIST